jgi:ribulose-phosphate 3-epimerase
MSAVVSSTCRGQIGPSVLACDMANLSGECKRVIAGGCDYIHLDVMDGHFVPNLTFGAPVIQCLRKNIPDFPLDVHLMVSNPMQWVDDMKSAGADVFTFHIEVEGDIGALIAKVKAAGMKVGIALKPKTPVADVLPYINDIDQVLIMTVEPGFGGQSFMPDMLSKMTELRTAYPGLDIMVDGGINLVNIHDVAKAGANMIVAGTSIFKPADCTIPIQEMKKCLNENGFN